MVVCADCKRSFAGHCGTRPFACPDKAATDGYSTTTTFKAPPPPLTSAEREQLIRETDDYMVHTGQCAYPSCKAPLRDITGWAFIGAAIDTSFVVCAPHQDYYATQNGYKFTPFPALAAVPSGKDKAMIEAKKVEDTKGWLDDAYKGSYGHNGCCCVCDKGWNRGLGPKEDDIFPIDGHRGAPKLFHLKCLESVKAEYPNTWAIYQRWLETGELEL